MASWKGDLQRNWHDLKIESVNAAELDEIQVGNDMKVEARVHLGQLKPEDVAVQIYHGPIDNHGNITAGESVPMSLLEQNNGSPPYFPVPFAITNPVAMDLPCASCHTVKILARRLKRD